MKDEQERDPSPNPEEEGAGVREKADDLVEAARRRSRGLLDRQKTAAVEELHSVADVMRDAARRFEEREEGGVAGYVEKAADYVEHVSSTLRERDLEDLLCEAEDALRRKPAVVLGAAAVVGFTLGRFLRASSQRIAKERRRPSDNGGKQS